MASCESDDPPSGFRRRPTWRLVTERTVPESQRRPSGSGGPEPIGEGPTIGFRDFRPCENSTLSPTRTATEIISNAPQIFSRKMSSEVSRDVSVFLGAASTGNRSLRPCRISSTGRESSSDSRFFRRLTVGEDFSPPRFGGSCQACTKPPSRQRTTQPKNTARTTLRTWEDNKRDIAHWSKTVSRSQPARSAIS